VPQRRRLNQLGASRRARKAVIARDEMSRSDTARVSEKERAARAEFLHEKPILIPTFAFETRRIISAALSGFVRLSFPRFPGFPWETRARLRRAATAGVSIPRESRVRASSPAEASKQTTSRVRRGKRASNSATGRDSDSSQHPTARSR